MATESSGRLVIDERTRVLVLTGSGVSTESGIPACGSREGIWDGRPLHWLASARCFDEDPELVWRFYSARREEARRATPNPAHHALARLEEAMGGRFLLVTQNVDGLHERAGNSRVVALHGSLLQSRCAHCDRPAFADGESYGGDKVALCAACEEQGRIGLLRPDVLWFGEPADPRAVQRIEDFVAQAAAASERLVLIVAGTSGRVTSAATVVEWAREAGAETWLVNQEPTALGAFDHFLSGSCGSALPELIAEGLEGLCTLRKLIAERTVELVVPLPEGSRSITGVSEKTHGVEMLALGLNGTKIRDWGRIVVRAEPGRVGKAEVNFWGQAYPTSSLSVDIPLTPCLRRRSDHLEVGMALYAADRTNGVLTLRGGRVVDLLPCDELSVPGWVLDCVFTPEAPPVGAVAFDELGLCVGFVEDSEPGGLATLIPAHYEVSAPPQKPEGQE